MKHYLMLIIAVATLLGTGCKETDSAVNAANNVIMRDTLKKLYPSLLQSQIRIEVHDYRNTTVLLGDVQLFEKTDEELKEIADAIGKLTYDIYEANNYLNKGEVIFTNVERRKMTDDDPKKEYQIDYKDYQPE